MLLPQQAVAAHAVVPTESSPAGTQGTLVGVAGAVAAARVPQTAQALVRVARQGAANTVPVVAMVQTAVVAVERLVEVQSLVSRESTVASIGASVAGGSDKARMQIQAVRWA